MRIVLDLSYKCLLIIILLCGGAARYSYAQTTPPVAVDLLTRYVDAAKGADGYVNDGSKIGRAHV